MRDYIDLSVLLNWVSMLRADVDGAILLVDDEDEARFYEKLVHKSARVVPAYSFATPLIESLTKAGVRGVLATVRGADTPESGQPNIFRPTLGDVASLMLTSNSCAHVIDDICGMPWTKACEKEIGPIVMRSNAKCMVGSPFSAVACRLR